MVLWDEVGFCGKTIFQTPKNCLLRACLDCFQSAQNLDVCERHTTGNQENDILTNPRPFRCPQSAPPGIEPPTFTTEVQHSDDYATGTLPLRHFAFSLSLFALAAKFFQALKNRFFCTALMKLREARLCKKHQKTMFSVS